MRVKSLDNTALYLYPRGEKLKRRVFKKPGTKTGIDNRERIKYIILYLKMERGYEAIGC
jgi:hypothetical protein